jgi:hypothetical protein
VRLAGGGQHDERGGWRGRSEASGNDGQVLEI